MKYNDKTYVYVHVEDNVYININHNVFLMFFNLVWNMRPFPFINRSTKYWFLDYLPNFITQIIRAVQFMIQLRKNKRLYHLGKNVHSIDSTRFGHILLKLREGEIKVFDLKKEEVTTILPKELSDIEVEIRKKRVKESMKCKMVPNVLSADDKERVIVEAYVNATSPVYDLNRLGALHTDLFPVLENIMFSTRPEIINFKLYYKEILNKTLFIMDEFYPCERFSSRYDYIRKCLLEFEKELNKLDQQKELYLVFSHGDLWEGNILYKKNKTYVIDWNTIGYRSFYFDFYYAMFMVASRKGHFDKVNEINLIRLKKALDISCEEFCQHLFRSHVEYKNQLTIPEEFKRYKLIFYLELILLKLESGDSEKTAIIGEVITWIKRFKFMEGLDESRLNGV